MNVVRRRGPYALTLLAGAALGFVFGDVVFPAIEGVVGGPLFDVITAIGGAALAAIAYEIVATFHAED